MLGKILQYLKNGDWDGFSRAVKSRIPRFIYYNNVSFIYELTQENKPADKLLFSYPDNYHTKMADEKDFAGICMFSGATVELYSHKKNAGDLFFAIFDNEEAVNVNLVHFGPCYVRGMGYLHPGEADEAYIYGIMTKADQRGKGLYKNGLIELADILFSKGISKIIQMVEDNNVPVLKTLPQLGYRRTKTVKHLTIFGLRWTETTDEASDYISKSFFIRHKKDMMVI